MHRTTYTIIVLTSHFFCKLIKAISKKCSHKRKIDPQYIMYSLHNHMFERQLVVCTCDENPRVSVRFPPTPNQL